MKHLLDKDVEVYQDIWVNGSPIIKGIRKSAERYNILQNIIPNGSTVLDIGSCYGYFGVRLATEKDCLVWSFEPDPIRVAVQEAVLSSNDCHGVVLSNAKVNSSLLSKLMSAVETIDYVMALSVAHYWKPEETSTILFMLSLYSPNLIIEVAQADEKEVANKSDIPKQNIMEMLRKYYESVEKIGEVQSSKDPDVNRPIYLCSNAQTIRRAYGYIGGKAGSRHDVAYDNGVWAIDGVEVMAGINVHNIFNAGLVYPKPLGLFKESVEAYYKLKSSHTVSDVRTWNLIYLAKGIMPIDYDGDFTPPNGETLEHYQERIRAAKPQDIAKELQIGLEFDILNP